MSRIYDNWERLLAAVLKRQQFLEMALAPPSEESSSRSTQSVSSSASSNRYDELAANWSGTDEYACVEFLLGNLKQLILYNKDLISGAHTELKQLHEDLETVKAILNTASKKPDEFKKWGRIVSKMVYDVEDTIDTCITQKAAKSLMRRMYGSGSIGLAKSVRIIREEKVLPLLQSATAELGNLADVDVLLDATTVDEARKIRQKAPVVEEDNVVGFDDEAEKVIKLLTEGSDDLEVISIVGMPGLGKTTLAKMIYRDPRIEFNFYNRAWVYVSQEYSRKEVFLTIFSNFIQVTHSVFKMNDETLGKELCKFLEKGKYLIVMDDVWTEEAWNDLKIAFPKNNKRSRILITSRMRRVTRIANPNKEPHDLRFLTLDESWRLLQRKALGSETSPTELLKDGMHIAKECGGIPLAIVVIGGILSEKGIDWWEKVSKSVEAYMALDQEKRMDNVLALSYNHLPHHLKSCFIYFGMFPEDFEIPVWRLVRLWIAEGFIQHQQQNEGMSLEDIAEEYLDELVNRNLVTVGDWRSNGKLKTCRIHDMLHEFCQKTAAGENFFHDIRQFELGTYATCNPALERYRRLCIHSRVISYISSNPVGPRVRSLLCFTPEEFIIPPQHISSVPGSFKLLRVLDARPIYFNRFPMDLTQLIHLRYIFLSSNFKIIPAALSSLWNIQTLLIETSSRTLDIKADIWKMIQLRHVKTNASMTLTKPVSKSRKSKDDKMMTASLQTLSMISPESCTDDIFVKAPNLKSLGVRGQLSKLLESKGGNLLFDSLAKLVHLENLKLLNDVYPRPPSDGKLAVLPMKYNFPPKLKKLTLSYTLLDWREMSVLGMLDYLEILKLKDNAFRGERWQPEDGGFRTLKVLHIGKTNLVHWEALAHHFPRLKRLFLRHCTDLANLPTGFADISSLELIDLFCTTTKAIQAARSIQEKKKNQCNQSTRGGVFKLSIYPPERVIYSDRTLSATERM